MKRLHAVPMLLAGVALPACAQRGGGAHGGFAGHASSGFHSGFSGGAARGFVGAPRYGGVAAGRPYGFRPGGYGYRRPVYPGYGYRGPYAARLRGGYPYAAPGWVGWNGLSFPGYLDDSGDSGYADNQPPAPGYDPSYQQPQPQAQIAAPPAYYAPRAPEPAPQPPAPELGTGSAEAVTLVFRDGRPDQQIHNYMMTRSTLYVRDQHPQEIPLDQLDLAATERLSRQAGADFQPPQ